MANVKLPYSVYCSMNEFIIEELERRKANNESRVFKKDIILEIAMHCSVSYDNINLINRNKSRPSIEVALRIADYFDADVEDIFKIV